MSFCMDNFKLDLVARERTAFDAAIKIAFDYNAPGKTAKSFYVDEEKGFVVRWHDSDMHGRLITKFRSPKDHKKVADIIWKWLQEQPRKDELNDSDVWEEPAYRIYCEMWGHIGHDHYAIIAVKPCTAWLGK